MQKILQPKPFDYLKRTRDYKYEGWRENYDENYVHPKDAWNAGFLAGCYSSQPTNDQKEEIARRIADEQDGGEGEPYFLGEKRVLAILNEVLDKIK